MKPIVWYTRSKTSPTMTPAAPARAEPSRNVTTITRSTSMPIIAAASRSCEVARIARPIWCTPTRSVNAIISASAEPMTKIRIGEMLSGPAESGRKSRPSYNEKLSYERKFGEKRSRAEFCRKKETPRAEMSGAMRGAFRNGR